MSFNANEHMMKLKGKDYLQVMWRLVWLRDEHPDWCIDTQILEMDSDHAVFKCVVADENGVQKSAGHGSESKKDFGDYIEKAETKAIGRALAMLGYGTQFVADELDEGERIVDSPVNRKPVHMPDVPKAETPAQIEAQSALPFNPVAALKAYMKECGLEQEAFGNMVQTLIKGGCVRNINSKDMTKEDVEALKNALRLNFSGVCK